MRLGLAQISLLVCAACVSIVACKEDAPATQVMVVIDAEPVIRASISDVDFSVRSGEGDVSTWSSRFEASLTQGSEAVRWPLEVALVPRKGETQRNYLVVATARNASGGIIAQVRAISGYVEGRSLSLPLIFDAACLALATLCEPTLTCRAGSCVNPFVAASTLLPFERGSQAGVGGVGGSGGAGSDLEPDAQVVPDTDAATNECADPTMECDPPPTVACSEERCAGCPEDFARVEDTDTCTPLLIGLGLSKGALAPMLDAYELSYRIELPLLADTVTFTPVVPDGVELELNGEPLTPGALGERAFVVKYIPLGESTVRLTLSAPGHLSRTYRFTLARSGAQRSFLKPHNTGMDDRFGHALAIDDDTIVVGAPGEDSNTGDLEAENDLRVDSGAAYVLVRDGPSFEQEAYLKASSIEAQSGFGTAVAIDGDTIAVSAPDEAMGGSVYVFTRSAGVWQEQQHLEIAPASANRRYGASLALRGDRLVVGAPADDAFMPDSGAVYVYERSGSSWALVTTVGPSEPQPLGYFGSGVAFQGDWLVVGATGESTESIASGMAYVFRRAGSAYEPVQHLVAPEPGPLDLFGDSVAIDGDTIAIGAFGASGTAAGNGAVYIYVQDGAQWALEQRLGASNPSQDAHFGLRVALRGDLLITGAYGEDSGGSGVNGDSSAAGRANSGAVYMFQRESGFWSQSALIKADPPGPGGHYGWVAAMDEDSIVVGAPGESSSATGIDGDRLDDTAEESGAVYIVR